MKKYYYLIVLALILALVLTGCSLLSNISQVPVTDQSGVSGIAKNGPPAGSICIGFEENDLYWPDGPLLPGASVEGQGVVHPLLNIDLSDSDNNLVLIEEGATSAPYAYDANYLGGTNNRKNGCLNGNYGIGCINTYPNINDTISFEFPEGVTISYFSITMLDYGDWIHVGLNPLKVKITPFNSVGDPINAHVIEETFPKNNKYDACGGSEGKKTYEINTSGIGKVQIEFIDGVDRGVGFDDICFTPEPIICETYLQAGNPKNGENDVGDVMLEYIPGNDYLTVTYTTDEPWLMNEIHFHAASDLPDSTWPVTKKGNPIPGHFDWVFEGLEGDERTEKTFNILIPEEVTCGELYFAAHAAVEKIILPAPRYPSTVVSFNQGLRKNGSAVTEGRSNPLQGLVYEANNVETNFFSLGFGGDIIVEFDCPIPNGEGDDLRIIEDTWGPYPLETAEVYASQDGSTWVPLGEANNTLRETGDNFHSFSAFDLGSLEWAKYIKVVDTTDPALHGSTADGFDLNAVEALQDCIQEETAWGDGPGFPGAKNWSMYFGCIDLVPCPF